MTKEVIATKNAPAAIGPYVQAVKTNGLLFTSGQIAIDPATQQIDAGGIEVQARRVMDNLVAILKEAGLTTDAVVKTTCFLKDINDFAVFNKIYGEYFTGSAPARSCVEIARLPKDVLVEVELIADAS